MRRPVVMGNWKLNGSKAMVTELLTGLNAELEGVEGVDVAVAPPALYIDLAERLIAEGGNKIILGAQNTDLNNSGAFTGDMSPEMLKDFGASHIIIGHSERREYHNESDEFIAKKFNFLKENGLTPVFCIGESEAQNEAGETEAVCARQINAVIDTYGVEALNVAKPTTSYQSKHNVLRRSPSPPSIIRGDHQVGCTKVPPAYALDLQPRIAHDVANIPIPPAPPQLVVLLRIPIKQRINHVPI